MYNLYDELTEEEEEKLIEQLAHRISEMEIDLPATLLLEMVKPFSFVGAQLGLITAPYLLLFGRKYEDLGYKYIRLFEKRENVERIIKHVEALKEEKKAEAEEQKGKKEEHKSLWTKIFEKIF